MVLDAPQIEKSLLAHTGHEHGTSAAQSEATAAPGTDPHPGSNASSDSKGESATEDHSPSSPGHHGSATGIEKPQPEGLPSDLPSPAEAQSAPTPVSTSGQSQPVPTTDRADLVGHMGGELVFALILAGPLALKQLRRWL